MLVFEDQQQMEKKIKIRLQLYYTDCLTLNLQIIHKLQ